MQIEWLLIAVVLLYTFIPEATLTNKPAVVVAMIFFTGVVLLFHYLGLRIFQGQWRRFVEILIMNAVLTVVVWFSGRIASPLLTLYLLVVVVSATVLGLKSTLLQTVLITVIYLVMALTPEFSQRISGGDARIYLLQLFPFWLVAYLAAMLAYEAQISRHRLAELANTDSLTKLWNMRMFTKFAEQEFERSSRYGRPFSMLMIDADNLKKVNDGFGHQAGSRMIQIMGEGIRENLRSSDVVARYGGDEFVVMLPETTTGDALATAERVRLCLEKNEFKTHQGAIPIVIKSCIGVAAFPEHDKELAGVMRKADAALYDCKRSGKNRCAVYKGTL